MLITATGLVFFVVVFIGGQKKSHLNCQNTSDRRPWYSHSLKINISFCIIGSPNLLAVEMKWTREDIAMRPSSYYWSQECRRGGSTQTQLPIRRIITVQKQVHGTAQWWNRLQCQLVVKGLVDVLGETVKRKVLLGVYHDHSRCVWRQIFPPSS